ncbi:PDZ domain-containing protein [Nonomuraea phyllanthi]|uniref:trypsin-like peptidase domain-containing protein n=1 Tax=Nonomuraea phyllanthi TaxID=2219224 RepID=UPI00129308F7|nr:trypsin-like peptidase domain-containing protein [Nonomuraea phyllanthi]QFY12665.1 PDZ domain-containing protein [Nonomuraea phyllanthi]
MTDETRPTEGRTPSDYPEPQGRPDFLPADDPSQPAGEPPGQPDGRAEPPASFGTSWGAPSGSSWGDPSGTSWGDPSGRPSSGVPPYGAPSFANPPPATNGPYGPPSSGGSGPYAATSSGGTGPDAPPSPGESGPYAAPPPGGSAPNFSGGGSPENPPPGGTGTFESPSPGRAGAFENPPPGGTGAFESPSPGRTGSFENPSFHRTGAFESPSFVGPDNGGNGTRAYEAPLFGGPPPGPTGPFRPPGHGGGTPPQPPRQAFPMGAGWAPPPPQGAHAFTPGFRRAPSSGFLISTAVVIALVASLLGSVGTYLLTRPSGANDPSYSLGPPPTGATARDPGSVAGVAARVLPSVVSIEAGTATEGASGSGFLIKNGYVVTNNHVVSLAADGGEIRIMFNNRKTTSARIVGRDPGSDLAVIKPEETFGTPEVTLGNSDQVVVGDPVIAIGSPLGLTGTVTTGIVSSLNRPVIAGDETGTSSEEPAYISAIQTDAAINPGNSGGPLVNGKGEVVGVNSAIATLGRSEANQSGSIGLGFAIPVNQTRRVAEELITTGKAKRPKIGIVLDRDYRGQGVRIASGAIGGRQPVDANGPADKAGLKAGDVILEIDGLALQDGNELIALIRSKAPGSKITVKYQRAGQEHTATLTVAADDTPTPTPS